MERTAVTCNKPAKSVSPCAAVESPEDQTGKWLALIPPAACGLLTSWGWCHALCTQAIIHPDTGEKIFMPFRMSGTSADEDLCGAKFSFYYFFLQFSILSPPPPPHQSFCPFAAFNHHLLARAGYVPFGTPIVSFIWRSCVFLTTHFTGLSVDVQTSVILGVTRGERMKWDFDLFWAKISRYSLVSFRSSASSSQIRQWCLPLYGRYSMTTHGPTIAFIWTFDLLESRSWPSPRSLDTSASLFLSLNRFFPVSSFSPVAEPES